ncbi:TerB family tellurite resistance protein [Sulfuricurvum sp. RIFCSPLOWO2_12_FULL_43_24]|uniref:TerB family tellurite resistance protein n=1 Tax=Sulfuricurvum sp. RIFCSPLOWO2_12_FULL_43_24 TaxID=1802247 RepID=UPI0008D51F07|nr:TerB family tellurite resistance protein [Sulfuricurvum sp. RIFCSPLOWO2_12_FULL_43_24]OHD85682.1 MAG: molecular chaperone DjlA [Sulfuricurvum sp. RIFCSPLOWO2_02_FULL_43_45]OHD90814.1 MAG: molecular chaperone DjlA [Sulfuricurvum sp. RIFCSPLOWO2_12_FULL_43_24]
MTQILILIVVVAIFYWLSRSFSQNQHTYTRNQFAGFKLNKDALAHSELGLFVALSAKVAKADGRVDELEAELVSNMFTDISALFPDPEATKKLLKEIFDEEKNAPHNLDLVAQALYKTLEKDVHKRQKMVEFLVNLTYIDGTLSQSEEDMLHRIAYHLGFSERDLKAMMERFGSYHRNSVKESSIDQAYALLGVTAEATNDEVKKAYRALVREYHPDIIKSQGASEEYLKEATEKVQDINAAYEMIKKSRGI